MSLWSCRAAGAVVAGVVGAGLLVPGSAGVALSGPLPAADRPAIVEEGTALATAEATGVPVEVTSLRDEYSQTLANPDGTFTLDVATAPQRARGADGAWQRVDPTLERRSDGTVGPRAAVVDLAFSGGGERKDLVRLGREGRSVGLTWPGSLPTPVLEGASAVYPEVIPGVDLRMTATAEGFHQVLVVKTAKAATSSALKKIEFVAAADDTRLVRASSGAVVVVDENGNELFAGRPAVMWDSSGQSRRVTASEAAMAKASGNASRRTTVKGTVGQVVTEAVEGTAEASPEEEPVPEPWEAPVAGDVTAVVPVTVSGSAVSVAPDVKVLTDPDTAFPVYVDPSLGWDVSRRLMLSSDSGHDPQWQFDGDEGMGKCPANVYNCYPGFRKRLFFQFPATIGGRAVFAGKRVLHATFKAKETWSFSCRASTVGLYRVEHGISSSTTWSNQPAAVDLLVDRTVSAGRGAACSPEQPDAWIEFKDNLTGADAEKNENLTSTVQRYADGKLTNLTVMLRAADESSDNSWKRFRNDATIQVTYVWKPGIPTGVGPAVGNGTTPVCRKADDPKGPLVVAATWAKLYATVQTAVQPRSEDEKGQLQAEWIVQRRNAATGTWSQVWSDYEPDSGWVKDGTKQFAKQTSLVDGARYRMRARTQSHITYNGKKIDLFSAYVPSSTWCYFTVDSSAPKAPTITAFERAATTSAGALVMYPPCTADTCPTVGGPGVTGGFRFSPGPGDTNVTQYRWWLVGKTTETTAGKSTVEVPVTPSLAGLRQLYVEARDTTGRWGAPTEYTFMVTEPSGAVGRWSFAAAAGTQPTTVPDTADDPTVQPLTLAGSAVHDARGRRGAITEGSLADHALRLNGTTSYAASSSAVVNTGSSFTVSAWVFLEDVTKHNSTVVAQADNDAASRGFDLYYSIAYQKWVFNWHWRDTAGTVHYVRSLADVAAPPARVWTHVTGQYDATAKTIQLLVNGRPQGQPVSVAADDVPVATRGPLQVGRGNVRPDVFTNYLTGMVDEVTVWQRAVTVDELLHDSQLVQGGVPTTSLVGHWSVDAVTSSTAKSVPDISGYGRDPLKLSGSGTSISVEDGLLTFDGSSGYAATTAAGGPVVDETGSFSVGVGVGLDAAVMAGRSPGTRAQLIGQRAGGGAGGSSWAVWFERDADDASGNPQGHWAFALNAVDATGTVRTPRSSRRLRISCPRVKSKSVPSMERIRRPRRRSSGSS